MLKKTALFLQDGFPNEQGIPTICCLKIMHCIYAVGLHFKNLSRICKDSCHISSLTVHSQNLRKGLCQATRRVFLQSIMMKLKRTTSFRNILAQQGPLSCTSNTSTVEKHIPCFYCACCRTCVCICFFAMSLYIFQTSFIFKLSTTT